MTPDRPGEGSSRQSSPPPAASDDSLDGSSAPPSLFEGRFHGRETFRGLVRLMLATAADEHWRHLVLSDGDFAAWPIGEREVMASLERWAGRSRQMRLQARDFAIIRAQHPRFVTWRQTWGHIVEAKISLGPGADLLPSAIWSDNWCLERLDPERDVVLVTRDPVRRVALKERLDAFWERGQPGFPSTILGL